jgi:putative N6-adenine-specific DNA methylase
MIAKTFFGFEEILAQELKALGAADVKIQNRMVEFYGDLGFMYKANYSLRTALRIQKPILTFSAKTEGQLYEKFKKFHWENYLDVNQTFMIDPTVFSDYFTHSHYAALKVKDAIVDRFKEKDGRRPSIDKDAPDVRFNLHISHDKITLSLDASGDSLHKRGYREETGPAPINEVLAAGLLLTAGFDGKGNYLDPMCGSGTMLIEAAMIANQIPAQIHRKYFAFQNWPDYDETLFTQIRNTRLNRIKESEYKIVGYEISPMMAKIAQANVKSADLEDFIEILHQDFFTSKKEMFPVLLVFNPPYDERIENNNQEFYKQIGDTLKANYPNTLAWFITSDLNAKKYVGLRPSRKVKVYNGKLECDFLQYEMYEGSKKTKNQNA